MQNSETQKNLPFATCNLQLAPRSLPLIPFPFPLATRPLPLAPCALSLAPCHSPSLKEGAFTLLELTISITILGIIILIIGSAMNVSFRSMNLGEKKIEALERIRASLKIIDSQIQSSIPLMFDYNGDMKYYFTGQKDSLRVATNYSLWSDNKGYVIVTYKVVSDDNGKKSLYAYENIIGIKDKREALLLEGFDEIYFEYFKKNLGKEKTSEEWEEESSSYDIPKKVRLHIIDKAKHLSIIIPLRVRELGL